jgi:hypothetical protein
MSESLLRSFVCIFPARISKLTGADILNIIDYIYNGGPTKSLYSNNH